MEYKEFLQTKKMKHEKEGVRVQIEDINPKLYPFQKKIVQWCLNKGKSAIFADCGLGKSPMQLEWSSVIHKKENKPVLIVAPLAVSRQTKREGKKFDIDVNIASCQDDIINGINITNYEKLDKFDPSSFVAIVLDESSILKSFDGKTTTKLIDMFSNTQYKLCCTATPSPNDFQELGNHSEFLNDMSRTEMLSMFFFNDSSKSGTWKLKGHAEKDFWTWVSSWAVMVRNPKEIGFDDICFDLPKLNIITKTVEFKKENSDELFALPVKGMNNNRVARKESLEQKVSDITEITNSLNGDQCLIWVDYNYEGELLKKAIKDSVEIKGSDKAEFKENAMIDFSENKIKTLITKPKIAGFGMNWQNCNNVIFCGISYSYESFYQAVRRCWRYGQVKDVNVYVVLSEYEKASLEAIKKKEENYKKMSTNIVKYSNKNFLDIKIEKEYKTMSKTGKDFDVRLGDSCELIKELEDNSIDYSIFSPPFASLYTYNETERDLGNSKTDEEFYDHFRFLSNELFRVIKEGRSVSFHCMLLPMIKFKDGDIGLKDFRGDLIRIFQDSGFIHHSEVVIWKNPVTAMQRTKALPLLYKQLKKDSSMCRQGIPDYLITMRKPGINKEPISHTEDQFSVDIWQKIASPVWMDINQSDTLQKESAREEKDEKHICPLQLEVIRRALYLWTNPGDLVFSPFTGIGSEGYVSLELGRKFIGFELKESYYKQAVRNLEIANEKKKQLYLFK